MPSRGGLGPHACGATADRIVVSLSTALGIEALPGEEAQPLLRAYNCGILELGRPFALWATRRSSHTPVRRPAPPARPRGGRR